MGKKFFATMIVAVVVVCASSTVYQSQNTNTLSDLALANVEALAESEESGGYNCYWDDANYSNCIRFGQFIGCPCRSIYWLLMLPPLFSR